MINFLKYLFKNKKYFFIPLFIFCIIGSMLILAVNSTAISPFLYTIF